MADFKTKYPSLSTVGMTFTSIASLPDDNTNAVAGAEANHVDNTSNLDLDHLVSGVIQVGTSPTAGRVIEVWAYAPISMASGTPTYGDVIDGTDSAETFTSRNVLLNYLKPVCALTVDNTTDRVYPFGPFSIADLFGAMPPFWGLFVVNRTGVALKSTGHTISYQRVQNQSV